MERRLLKSILLGRLLIMGGFFVFAFRLARGSEQSEEVHASAFSQRTMLRVRIDWAVLIGEGRVALWPSGLVAARDWNSLRNNVLGIRLDWVGKKGSGKQRGVRHLTARILLEGMEPLHNSINEEDESSVPTLLAHMIYTRL